MSLEGRITELTNKHRQLEQKIFEEQKRPSADTLKINDLKRRKLRVKEQIQAHKAS